MKKLLLIACLALVGLIFMTSAQAQQATSLVNGKAFANNNTDTTNFLLMGSAHRIAGYFTCTDTVNVKVYVDIRYKGVTAWTIKDSTTITATSATGTAVDIPYRSNVLETIPGMMTEARWRFAFQGSGNGLAGTRTYSFVMKWAN